MQITRLFGRIAMWATLSNIPSYAQSNLLNTNLIVNGNAEGGDISTPPALVASIPGWTRNGTVTVVSYGTTGYLATTDPAPPDHSFQYFYAPNNGGNQPQTLTQSIDVSSAASLISTGNVKFTASAYIGGTVNGSSATSKVTIAFQNAKAQSFSTITLGPQNAFVGLYQQQSVGAVPSGTVMVTVTITFTGGGGAADSLSLMLSQLGTATAGSVLGKNLVANPGFESGPSAVNPTPTAYVPGWSTTAGMSVAPYGGTGWVQSTDLGPVDRGSKLAYRTAGYGASAYQEIDVSPAATLIDASQITFQISGWLGSLGGNVTSTLTYSFYDWSGNQLGTTGTIGPVYPPATGLMEAAGSDTLPAGTRRVHIELDFGGNTFSDNISFILSAPNGPPVIDPGGIINLSAFGGGSGIAQASWVEIYGRNLASTTAAWGATDFVNGVGPTTLQGVSVTIGGEPAFVNYVSPGQIDVLLPSDALMGVAPIVITNANGSSDPFYVAVSATQPALLAPTAFNIGKQQYVAAFNPDGTFALPQNAVVGVASTPAASGQTIVMYGIGFGPVSDGVTAGTLPAQQDSLTLPLVVNFGTTKATLGYAGLATGLTGLYQINVVVPQLTSNAAEPISFTLNGTKGNQTLYIAIK